MMMKLIAVNFPLLMRAQQSNRNIDAALCSKVVLCQCLALCSVRFLKCLCVSHIVYNSKCKYLYSIYARRSLKITL